jgi:ComF family protein
LSNRIHDILNNCLVFVQRRVAQPCLLCLARSHAGLLCAGCAADLPRLPADGCPRCARPGTGGHPCGPCLIRPPAFDAARAVYRFAFPVDVLIHRLKYHADLAVAAWLAERMAEGWSAAPRPDLLVPMPLHPRRLRERGFNQSALLAHHLGRRLGIRVDLDACRRVRDTPPQVGLPLAARRKNIRDAFACAADLGDRRVALVDDVLTSGASLDELARTVRRAGAAEVDAWVAARTDLDGRADGPPRPR